MPVTHQQRAALMVECTMIAKDFIEASHAVHNSQYPAFRTQLDQIDEKLEKLKSKLVYADSTQ